MATLVERALAAAEATPCPATCDCKGSQCAVAIRAALAEVADYLATTKIYGAAAALIRRELTQPATGTVGQP